MALEQGEVVYTKCVLRQPAEKERGRGPKVYTCHFCATNVRGKW